MIQKMLRDEMLVTVTLTVLFLRKLLLFVKIILFFYLFLAVLGLQCCADLSLAVVSKGCSLVTVHRLLIAVASLAVKHWLQGGQASVAAAPSSGAQAQQLWCPALVVPQHVGSSRIRDPIHLSCIGSWILCHLATQEVQADRLHLKEQLLITLSCFPPIFIFNVQSLMFKSFQISLTVEKSVLARQHQCPLRQHRIFFQMSSPKEND